jgi:hypothetical protein
MEILHKEFYILAILYYIAILHKEFEQSQYLWVSWILIHFVWLCSQLFVIVTSTWEKQYIVGNIYLFQKFQPMVLWFHASARMMRQYLMTKKIFLMAARKQRDRGKGPGKLQPQEHVLIGLLHWSWCYL